jgi:deoxycytidine triphosphate deaminase
LGLAFGGDWLTVLSCQTIQALCSGVGGSPAVPLITDTHPDGFRSASYDLRLGDEYFLSGVDVDLDGPIATRRFTSTHKTVEVPANQVVLVRMRESLCLPNDLVGHLTLKLDVLLEGLIMASQSQVDAGYRGSIYALLYNLSSRGVALHQDQSLIRIEFSQLDQSTSKPYSGDYKPDWTLADAMRTRITSSLEMIQREAMQARRTAQLTTVGAVIGIGAIIVGLLGPLQQQASDATAEVALLHEVVNDLRREGSATEEASERPVDAQRRRGRDRRGPSKRRGDP